MCKQAPPLLPEGLGLETLIRPFTNIALAVTFPSNLDPLEIFQAHADRDCVRLCKYLLEDKEQTFQQWLARALGHPWQSL